MTQKKAEELLPKYVRPILKALPLKHWEEFAMVWMFHDKNRVNLMGPKYDTSLIIDWRD